MSNENFKNQYEYIKAPNRCPNKKCNSDEIEGGSVTISESMASQEVWCSCCCSEWTDTYNLAYYKLTQPGADK